MMDTILRWLEQIYDNIILKTQKLLEFIYRCTRKLFTFSMRASILIAKAMAFFLAVLLLVCLGHEFVLSHSRFLQALGVVLLIPSVLILFVLIWSLWLGVWHLVVRMWHFVKKSSSIGGVKSQGDAEVLQEAARSKPWLKVGHAAGVTFLFIALLFGWRLVVPDYRYNNILLSKVDSLLHHPIIQHFYSMITSNQTPMQPIEEEDPGSADIGWKVEESPGTQD